MLLKEAKGLLHIEVHDSKPSTWWEVADMGGLRTQNHDGLQGETSFQEQ